MERKCESKKFIVKLQMPRLLGLFVFNFHFPPFRRGSKTHHQTHEKHVYLARDDKLFRAEDDEEEEEKGTIENPYPRNPPKIMISREIRSLKKVCCTIPCVVPTNKTSIQ